jgi:type II secretory pathway component GspD/PulD (secretin)
LFLKNRKEGKMKRNFRLAVLVFIFSLGLSIPKLNADSKLPFFDQEPEISMDFKDASLKDILKLLSIQSGMNFIASQDIEDRKITLYLDKVPLRYAMDKLFIANRLSYELDTLAKIFVVKKAKAEELEIQTRTRVFFLKHASVGNSPLMMEASGIVGSSSGFGTGESSSGTAASEQVAGITDSVKKLLSSLGSVIEDSRTNSLIVTDTPGRLELIAQVIASLDISVPQVLLEVEMLDVSKNTVDQLGVNWPTTLVSLNVTGTRLTSFPFFGSKADNSTAGTRFPASTLTAIGATLTLDFLRSQTDTRFLARPRILTLSNESAEIRIATNESIGVTTTTSSAAATTSASPERAQTGVILRVTPQVNPETGEITMFVFPKVAEAVAGSAIKSGSTGTANYQFRDPEERSTKSVIRVKDGDTIVIGGLIRNELTRTEAKLPILGDIPLLGALFRHRGGTSSAPDKNKERELLVFITPHIIKSPDIKLAQAKKAILIEREQGASSGASRDLQISESLDTLEKKKR